MNKIFNNVYTKFSKLNELRKNKTIIFIVSTMRSGSTMLKSLLANASDTSHLPEIDFQKYNNKNTWKFKTLSTARIIIIKKPAPFNMEEYPLIPDTKNCKIIILVRDVYDTVTSIKKMNQAIYSDIDSEWTYEKLVHEYWYTTYKNILDKLPLPHSNHLMVRYEDLIENPIAITKQIFQFIGSEQKEGVAQYYPPKKFQWKWGSDDGGQKLKSLKVQTNTSKRTNQELIEIIKHSPKITQLRNRLGY